jgi:hypothetical protein
MTSCIPASPLALSERRNAVQNAPSSYNIFLMTRVHQEAKVHGTRRGALIGLAATGG